MTIEITGRHLNVSQSVRDHVEEKIQKLGRLVENLDLHVTLEEERFLRKCHIVARDGQRTHSATVTDEDLFKAVNESVDVLARQLRKDKTSRLQHRRDGADSIRHADDGGATGGAVVD